MVYKSVARELTCTHEHIYTYLNGQLCKRMCMHFFIEFCLYFFFLFFLKLNFKFVIFIRQMSYLLCTGLTNYGIKSSLLAPSMQQCIYLKIFLKYQTFYIIFICTQDITLRITLFTLALKLKLESACHTLNREPVEFRRLTINRIRSCYNHIMHHITQIKLHFFYFEFIIFLIMINLVQIDSHY